jgi:hypothetical protein
MENLARVCNLQTHKTRAMCFFRERNFYHRTPARYLTVLVWITGGSGGALDSGHGIRGKAGLDLRLMLSTSAKPRRQGLPRERAGVRVRAVAKREAGSCDPAWSF